ncbi:oligosaccharyl transferase, archaeosortase A system-associated [Chloroflexota bacterium]
MIKHQEAGESRLSPGVVTCILLTLFFAVSLFIRVYLPYDRVFVGDWIKYTSADAYFHMRVVDLLVHNFPNSSLFDPYLIYPGGMILNAIYFYDWLLAGIIWVVGLGHPTAHTIDIIGVYFPAVLGALTIIPVYFIGREMFGRWAGLLSAGLIAILPGEFLGRSILGFTDHHVAEVLFTTITMLFLLMAIKTASQRQLTFGHLMRRHWSMLAKPALYSLLAGVFMAAYILTFRGALFFVFIVTVYLFIQFIIDHVRRKSTDYLCFVGVIFFFVALMIPLPILLDSLSLASLIIALIIPLVLSGISLLMVRRGIKPGYYPLTLVGLGVIGVVLLSVINPALFGSMKDAFSAFNPTGASLTTIEMQPILSPAGKFTLAIVWGNFTTSFFLGLISLLILIYLVIRQGETDKSLLVVWSLVMLAATIGQRRFAYYFAVNAALLTGYLAVVIYYLTRIIVEYFAGKSTGYLWSKILEFTGSKGQEVRLGDTPKKDYYGVLGITRKATNKEIGKAFRNLASKYKTDTKDRIDEKFKEMNEAYQVLSNASKRAAYDRLRYSESTEQVIKKESNKSDFRFSINHISMSLGVVFVVFILAFFPNPRTIAESDKQANITFGQAWWDTCLLGTANHTASQARFAPSDGWVSSLNWMKENTPEPFGSPDAYYQLYQPAPPGESYKHPESAYGVMAWWDYGYWIARIAHRIPNANPSQDPQPLTNVAKCFTAQDEDSANEIVKEFGASYIIMDHETATGKFWAVTIWSGKGQSEFFGIYYLPQENKLVPLQLFHPNYYRSFAIRLYNFDGQAVTPENAFVISYKEEEGNDGVLRKIVTNAQQFTSYEDAESYLSSQGEGNYKIIGVNPLSSPVPLEELEHYKLIYSSNSTVTISNTGPVPAVKVFEYID